MHVVACSLSNRTTNLAPHSHYFENLETVGKYFFKKGKEKKINRFNLISKDYNCVNLVF